MSEARDTWKPTATREMLERRAAALAQIRRFFADRGVLEVDTPIVVNAGVTDVHVHSARVQFMDASGRPNSTADHAYFLHTSPEYAMKRLLAAGSGDIYQICHVMRALERGRHHNPEFTLIEWYRVGRTLDELMTEVDELVRAVLGPEAAGRHSERIAYREAFLRELQLDPFTASHTELSTAAHTLGFEQASTKAASRDEILDLLMGGIIGPRLGHGGITFVHGYPASQAALARLDPRDPRAALRFELYCDGIELANGFHELAVADEQRARFERDLLERARLGLPAIPIDERLLAALQAGLPDCVGVAVGFDRLLMVATKAPRIEDVLAFATERA